MTTTSASHAASTCGPDAPYAHMPLTRSILPEGVYHASFFLRDHRYGLAPGGARKCRVHRAGDDSANRSSSPSYVVDGSLGSVISVLSPHGSGLHSWNLTLTMEPDSFSCSVSCPAGAKNRKIKCPTTSPPQPLTIPLRKLTALITTLLLHGLFYISSDRFRVEADKAVMGNRQ